MNPETKIWQKFLLPGSIIIGSLIIAGTIIYSPRLGGKVVGAKTAGSAKKIAEEVTPAKGIKLPIKWNGLGSKLVASGVIDKDKFEQLYADRGDLSADDKAVLFDAGRQDVIITTQNSGFILNLLWAAGLGNKNEILEKGPISDKRYGGAGQFASTGGWTLAKGDVMSHFSQHDFITLTPAQQALVKKVAANIYRPCCDNPTLFPDCNHGMAMLALLEIMASQNVSEADMYQTALAVNSYWFPGTYLILADFMAGKGISWKKIDPKELLGPNYSSASGYKGILLQTNPQNSNSGGSSCST